MVGRRTIRNSLLKPSAACCCDMFGNIHSWREIILSNIRIMRDLLESYRLEVVSVVAVAAVVVVALDHGISYISQKEIIRTVFG